MAIEGILFIKTNDKSRVKEITNFIWNLNFKKEVRVDISIYFDEPNISAISSRIRYLVNVNPNIKLIDIKDFLLKKGYITDDE